MVGSLNFPEIKNHEEEEEEEEEEMW